MSNFAAAKSWKIKRLQSFLNLASLAQLARARDL